MVVKKLFLEPAGPTLSKLPAGTKLVNPDVHFALCV